MNVELRVQSANTLLLKLTGLDKRNAGGEQNASTSRSEGYEYTPRTFSLSSEATRVHVSVLT